MISAIGVRNVVENRVDFTNSRNLIIAAVILVSALGFNSVGGLTFAVAGVSINLSGLAIAAIVGNMIANQYATTLNVALNASTYKIIKGNTTEDTEYFKAGFASDEEREAYEAELCATVEAEGAALLKNDNAALPLADSAKVSLFGHGSVDLMYGGTGSGSVDTSKAPNLKQALEAQGITINQTLWDLYSSCLLYTSDAADE